MPEKIDKACCSNAELILQAVSRVNYQIIQMLSQAAFDVVGRAIPTQ